MTIDATPAACGQGSHSTDASVDTESAAATHAVGRAVGELCLGGEVLGLIGTLGAGKTCFVKGLADALGVAGETVSSPTFALIHEYEGRLPMCHADLYRLEAFDALHGLGLEEYTDSRRVTVIEWADKAPAVLPSDHLMVRFEHLGNDSRRLTFHASGGRAKALLASVLAGRYVNRPEAS